MSKPYWSKNIYFITDLHADVDAFEQSLALCEDPNALYLIGGDCLDKGPSNLKLLRAISELRKTHNLKILASNHDLRMLMALRAHGNNDPKFADVFSEKRMRNRIDPLLKECGGWAAAKNMFLSKKGEFGWFFSELEPFFLYRNMLFVHAGVSDTLVHTLSIGTRWFMNGWNSMLTDVDALHDFYFSDAGALFRTKYRKSDAKFSKEGAKRLLSLGIDTIVHGHNSQAHGHSVNFVQGIRHVNCDCTVDINSRKKEGLGKKSGYAVAKIDPQGNMVGISTDGIIECKLESGT